MLAPHNRCIWVALRLMHVTCCFDTPPKNSRRRVRVLACIFDSLAKFGAIFSRSNVRGTSQKFSLRLPAKRATHTNDSFPAHGTGNALA
jgi:hypothetical protein